MESIVFKKALMGGFKKRDVMVYIDNLLKNAQEAEEQLKGQIDSLTVSRNDLQRQVDEFSLRVGELEGQLVEAKENIEFLNLENKRMQAEIVKAKRLEKEEEEFQKEKEELLARIRQLEEKGKKYDEINQNLGAIYVEAHQNVSKLLEDAKRRSQLVEFEASNIIDNMAYNVEDFRHSVESLRRDVKSSVYLIERKLDDIIKALDDSLARFKERVQKGEGPSSSDAGAFTAAGKEEDNYTLSQYFN